MSRELLRTADVPNYIREIVQHLHPDKTQREGGVWGFNFKLYGKHKIGYESQLDSDCKKLIAWCRRYYADAGIVEKKFWWDQVSPPTHYNFRGSKWHRQKAYRNKVRNYIIVFITDPVAHRFEKDGFYRNKKRGAR